MKLLLSIIGLFYTFCPYDLLPDFIIGFGWIDDISVLFLLWWFYSRWKKKQQDSRNYYQRGDDSSSKESRRESSYERASETGYYSSGKEEILQDPYKTLDVRPDATPEEIKRAYRQLVNKYHPDKVIHLGREFQELAEERFKNIQKAYRELMP